MLLIRRQVGESIFIGDDIKLRIKALRKDCAFLEVISPRNLEIRKEDTFRTFCSPDHVKVNPRDWITIDGNIRVLLLMVSENRAALGFVAPQNVPIWREEIVDKVRRNRDIPLSSV